ncbi:MAG TPA: DUF1003 domain-containing protein [Leptospiraceae bacterium]|nr:DUF1003 domain-containing protein [Leptospiraceae bacterium]HRG74232.1 DUF1003 domain-containing protein [Leptospiraceae bacterium]
MEKIECNICNRKFLETDLIVGHGIRHEIEDIILIDFPAWNDEMRICKNDFNTYRIKYASSIIEEEKGSIQELEKAVLVSIEANEILSSNINITVEEYSNIGDKISDQVAFFGGSWKFIILFFIIFILWIIMNSLLLQNKKFDPFPFILMNLILSCIAALQAPIIMMSQNRQAAKDRIRSDNDYKINLKSEIEIRTLHEKVDHLLLDQWSKMMKIQAMQIEMLEEIKKKMEKRI